MTAIIVILFLWLLCYFQAEQGKQVVTSNANILKRTDTDSNNCSLPAIHSKRQKCNSPWQYISNGTCHCGDWKLGSHCVVGKNMTIQNGVCVTYQELGDLSELGKCLYTFKIIHSDNAYTNDQTVLPMNMSELNERLCGKFNRNGTLCGKCKNGYFPQVYSFNMTCIECPNGKANWWKYVLATFLPITLFYFVILLFRINITSSNLQGFVYCSQGIVMPAMMRTMFITVQSDKPITLVARYLGALYGIWNLDFFRFMDLGICLGTHTLETLALDLIVGVYPFFLMLLTYILIDLHDRNFRLLVAIWRPFGKIFGFFRRNWEIRTSLIDAFATFFLLSNVKFVSVTYDILVPVFIQKLNSTGHIKEGYGVYFDATIPHLGDEHVPYAYLAISIFIFLVLLPTAILFLYPFSIFQKFLNLFPVRWHVLHTFMDAFQGCYKDGTQPGTRDCRWFASMFLIVRLVIMVIGGVTESELYFSYATMVLVIMAILIINFQPFKANISHLSDVNAIFILILALWYASSIALQESDERRPHMVIPIYAAVVTAGVLPLLYISAIIVHWMYKHRRFGLELVQRLHAQRQGYSLLLQ